MDIALLHYSAPPIVGGVERVIGRHASLMAQAGHTVRIVAGRGGSSDPAVRFVKLPLADSLNPEIVQAGEELAGGSVPRDFGALAERLAVALRAAVDGVDVVIAHNVASLGQNLALSVALHDLATTGSIVTEGMGRYSSTATPRLILWHHDLAWTMARYQPRLHEGWPWSLLREPWPGAVNVTISEHRRGELATLIGVDSGTIAVVPGGVDMPDLPGLRQLADCDPLLLAPVRITPRKNVELALRVVAAIRSAGKPAGLVVTGPVDPHNPVEHSYQARLAGLRKELDLDTAAVFMAEEVSGSPSNEDLASLYGVSDALILPSRDEGFGLPILEAAAARLPIFCSDLPPLRALAVDDATYFSPDAEPAELAALILRVLEANPAARLARRVRRDYSWPRVYERFIEPLLQSLVVRVPH
jgi:mannosylglucosylglycerate synthase